MRLSPLALFAGAAALVRGQSLDPNTLSSKKSTVFNGVTVPPPLELTPANFKEEITKTRFLMIKFYRYLASCSRFLCVGQCAPETDSF